MMMCNIFQFCLLSCLVIFASSNETGEDDDPLLKSAIDGTGSEIRRHLATIPGRRLGRLNRNPSKEEIDALRKSLEGLDPSEWNRFSKPHNENVDGMDCFVEVQMTQKVPGKCTVLGGRVPVCRAGKLVNLDPNSCSGI